MSKESEKTRRLWVALRHQAQLKGFRVVVRSMEATASAYCDYGTKKVVISDRLNPADALARLAHEVGHVYLHTNLSLQDRGIREIEAELFAYAMLADHGIRPDDSLLHYIASWAMRVAPHAPEDLVGTISEQLVPATRQVSVQVHRYLRDHMQPARSGPAEPPFLPSDHDGPVL
ncbi:hypothetical protein GCM10029976_032070 [Kribbella albertanoniae]|uniref:ImmA/IrrE family metallo-endopeptidase n=1 Tax=Kribbella albertanoniae TaxID=1266829 RepID=A0A4R4QID8_9ACTN|nr:ImmA/IrrE family metallo-endopeptidase [Kribbella albertanoniae]TDC34982.1 ImmA/IrrE family metallo-endopeptidase [Kribbella albertanoniae]